MLKYLIFTVKDFDWLLKNKQKAPRNWGFFILVQVAKQSKFFPDY